MSEGRKVEPGRVLTRPMSLLLIAGTFALAGCEGDTLYDVVPPDVEPPVVTVLSPTDGGVNDISARAVDPGGQVCSPF